MAVAELVSAASVAVTVADVEANPTVDIDAIVATTAADASATPVAPVTATPAPLVAVADRSLSSSPEEANVGVTVVPFTGPTPGIASSWSNAIPMAVN